MKEIFIDYETFYDVGYSLKQLPTLLYIRDPRFKVHGAAVAVDDDEPFWVTGAELRDFYAELPWDQLTEVVHNSIFDRTITWEKYGHRPLQRVDTLGLCRALLPRDVDFDIDNLGQILKVGGKAGGGDALKRAKGIRDLPPDLEAEMAEYAVQDVHIMRTTYRVLWPNLPAMERQVMNQVIRMSCEGVLQFDHSKGKELEDAIEEDRQKKLAFCGVTDKKQLTARDQFAKLLTSRGVPPPTKVSPRTGEVTYAFSKQDPEYVALKAEPKVADLIEAREAWASNNAISRARNLMQICSLPPYTLPVQVHYNKAHTGRLGGGGKINMLNLNARGPQAKLRQATIAPPGKVIVGKDLSGIEMRMNLWFSGEWDLLKKIEKGLDPYIDAASDQFNIPYDQIDKNTPEGNRMRQFGKVRELACFGGDTLVLVWTAGAAAPTQKPISCVTCDDWLWDGEEWVQHRGVLDQGTRPTILLHGIRVTPDHKMLCGNRWLEAQVLAQDEHAGSLALETASASLPLLATNLVSEAGSGSSSCNAAAEPQITELRRLIYGVGNLLAATLARKNKQGIGSNTFISTLTSSLTTAIGGAYSTVSALVLTGATTPTIEGTPITADAVFTSMKSGGNLVVSSSNIWSRLKGGMSRTLNSIESITTKVMNLGILGSSLAKKTWSINALSNDFRQNYKLSEKRMRVYDIAYAGTRNRFTILTEDGPLIVHNCGFQMSANKFRTYCAAGPLGMDPIKLSEEEASAMVYGYRRSRPWVKASWDYLQYHVIPSMTDRTTDYRIGPRQLRDEDKPIQVKFEELVLPNGLSLKYPNLRAVGEDDSLSYMWGIGKNHKIYAGIVQENCVQALSGVIIKEHMVEIENELGSAAPIVHQVYDEILVVCDEREAEYVAGAMDEIMSKERSWAPGLPLKVEGGWDYCYSK